MEKHISTALPDDLRPFEEGLRAGEFRYQQCGECGRAQFPPSPVCRSCQHSTLTWKPAQGGGAIHSVTIVHRAPSRAFSAEGPYVLALVDLDENLRIMVNIRGEKATEAKIGDRVRLIFETHRAGPGYQCELA